MKLIYGFFPLQVFDECHHTQKNNPFNKIAFKYTQLTAEQQAHLQVCHRYVLQAFLTAVCLLLDASHGQHCSSHIQYCNGMQHSLRFSWVLCMVSLRFNDCMQPLVLACCMHTCTLHAIETYCALLQTLKLPLRPADSGTHSNSSSCPQPGGTHCPVSQKSAHLPPRLATPPPSSLLYLKDMAGCVCKLSPDVEFSPQLYFQESNPNLADVT